MPTRIAASGVPRLSRWRAISAPAVAEMTMPAAGGGAGWAVATVAIVVTYEFATIATMVTLVAVARAGVARLRGPRVERWAASAAGASIAMTGIAVALLGW
jgi:hypothetical protein